MADIYEQHQSAFAAVAAWVILDGSGEPVATVAIKYPRDGAGRLYAYLHLRGVPMVRAHASGGGYDKHSAAISDAIAKIPAYAPPEGVTDDGYGTRINANRAMFQAATAAMDGNHWHTVLERAGFRVVQAV